MLAGPPRPFFVLSILLLSILLWSYSQPNFALLAPLLRYNCLAQPPIADPLDFSTPLRFTDGESKPPGSNYSWVVVIPKTMDEDLQWIQDEVPEAQLVVYEVDNPYADYRVPKNKGKEAMTYLTYMIDHYNNLPDIVVFLHAHELAWHNNELLEKMSIPIIRRLNHDRVARMGYMNLRCHHDPGCPDWIHLDRPEGDFDLIRKPEEQYWRRNIWEQLHPGAPAPRSLSGICCAQFALSRDRIRQVPIERLHHYRQWLLKTKLEDEESGRIFEYIWHYIFTGRETYCPAENTCYCDGYGICFGGRQDYDEFWGRCTQHAKDEKALESYTEGTQEAERNGESEERIQRLKWKVEEMIAALADGDAWMRRTLEEAFERGNDWKKRAAETENWEMPKL